MINDFSTGEIKKNIIRQALPLMAAQAVSILYNVVDRIYIGHIPEIGTVALTGVGLAFPLTTLIAAFAHMYSSGGGSLFAIERGAKRDNQAENVLTHTVLLILLTSLLLTVFCFLFRKPILFLFGASESAYPYADEYLKIYLWGTVFTMFSSGLNTFINGQGYPQLGMWTVLLGALLNLILDPLFIFVFGLGVKGAAIATVLSQFAGFIWVLLFFLGKKTLYHITLRTFKADFHLLGSIFAVGISGFIALGTNSLVQIICNKTLMAYGGDLFISAITILYSIREILSLPVTSISTGAQPVLGYNLGARRYEKVKEGIRFQFLISLIYTVAAWLIVIAFPEIWLKLFTADPELLSIGIRALKIYFFGFCFMTLQAGGQCTFVALRCPKRAIFFSLLRKVIIVAPLTILLPALGFGTDGVFLAEPISNVLGGTASFLTMYFTLYKRLGKDKLD